MAGHTVDVARRFERRAPRSAGLAGIAFSLLFLAAVGVTSQRPPEGLTEAGLVDWFETVGRTNFTLSALYLIPFSGIAFLWFLGVIRDRIGSNEDRFFATVFLGSGLLFVGMLWAAGAAIGSLVVGGTYAGAPDISAASIEEARGLGSAFFFVLDARAAAVFTLVTSTIALRTQTFPRWLIIAGYLIGLVMLLSLFLLQWILLLFPLWVLVMSLFILNSEIRTARATSDGAEDAG